ncbi:hypothetical protein [Mycolicibacterium nivoides]|jgi:hypothetical protein|uniref:Uncharacterized protein n=1 Tax=Mycolicibacterium nivoides TaxID=2487344 RepID=A0ABW9LG23_9MYCO|nr:hypothetical protein [Mycolicibacterium nivoides]SER89336.1 hypothetical protein SAMN04488583_0070 [Mycobacterium sp. 88mf]SFF49641.1 hypothetical protein SAMN04488582_1021074 [Mycobacterium sp. 455mf]
MTVQVTRNDGVTDEFGRFGDCYIKHTDGSLEVVRAETMPAATYPAGRWTEVVGDEKRRHRGLFHHRT